MPLVDCYLQTLSQTYANGLPRVEVYVCTTHTRLVPIPPPGVRVPITVVAHTGIYQGGLRDNQSVGWPYICPDLADASGKRISLAQIMHDDSVPLLVNQSLRFAVSGHVWTLI